MSTVYGGLHTTEGRDDHRGKVFDLRGENNSQLLTSPFVEWWMLSQGGGCAYIGCADGPSCPGGACSFDRCRRPTCAGKTKHTIFLWEVRPWTVSYRKTTVLQAFERRQYLRASYMQSITTTFHIRWSYTRFVNQQGSIRTADTQII